MREPVSIRAVASSVTEPPCSTLRARPKKRRGITSAAASMPPERLRPAPRLPRLKAPRQPREAVEQQDDVVAALQLDPDMRQHQLGQCGMFGRATVAGAGEDLGRDGAPEVGQFLGALVDQQHHDARGRPFGADGAGDLLQEGGLAGLGRRDDHPACALADGREQVYRAHRGVAARAEVEALRRIDGGKLGERRASAVGRGRHPADRVDARQLTVLPPLPDGPADRRALDQGELLHQAGRHGDLARGRLHRVDQDRAAAAAFQDAGRDFRHRSSRSLSPGPRGRLPASP